jgi:hypothetical protein
MRDPRRPRFQRSAAILSVFSLAVLTAIQVLAAEAREYPVTVVKDLERSSRAPSGPAQYIISVDGAQCTTMDEFRQAILRLPAGFARYVGGRLLQLHEDSDWSRTTDAETGVSGVVRRARRHVRHDQVHVVLGGLTRRCSEPLAAVRLSVR